MKHNQTDSKVKQECLVHRVSCSGFISFGLKDFEHPNWVAKQARLPTSQKESTMTIL